MIRILHVIGAMDRGGAETMIMNFYREIDKSNFQFDFLVHETRDCDFNQEIRRLGGRIYSVPRYKIYNYVSYKKHICNFFENHHDYDIVHGHICSCINIYLGVAKKYGIKTIAHSHASNFGVSLDTLFTKAVSFRTRYLADFFFGCSRQAGMDRYGKEIVNSNKFDVLNNGIKTELYLFNNHKRQKIRNELGIEDKIVVGHVGRFTYAKNHEFVIKVFKEIYGMNKDSVLLLFGRGELENQIREQVRQEGLEKQVYFMGVVDNIYDYLNAMDVFIFPSRFEGLGIALVEAQASGLPCVISNVIPQEAVLSRRVKKIDLAETPKKWAEVCVKSLDNIDRRKENSLVAGKGFDIGLETQKIAEIYKRILSKRMF